MAQAIQALFFLAVVAGLAYFVSKLMGASAFRMAQGRRIRLIEVVSLGPRRHACLVSVGPRMFLLGVTDQCISRIAEFCETEATALGMHDAMAGTAVSAPDFVSKLSSFLKGRGEGRER